MPGDGARAAGGAHCASGLDRRAEPGVCPGIDLVYTWVDDCWPGYLDLLRAHAGAGHDLNPNRTRDNLDLLRYSLRSVARCMPWVRNIHVLTCRPQVPRWLASHPRVRLVHHDEVMEPHVLPTFSSFAIVSHLSRIPGLSRRFVYMEDDMLLGAPVEPGDFVDARGRLRVYPRLERTAHPSLRGDARVSPWNAALARCNHLLAERFGRAWRRTVNHVPLFVDRELWNDMLAEWPDAVAHTRASRFRRAGNVAPEYLYPHYALARGRAVAEPVRATYRTSVYFPLENRFWQMRLQRALVERLRPKFVTLNDNFDAAPDARVVSYVRDMLERWYPQPSPFERASPVQARTAQEIPEAAH
jgi:hypothetical protein